MHTVNEKRATFSRSNILAEALRQLHGVRFATPHDRIQVAERTAALALDTALLISPPELTHTPQHLLRQDGTSRFRPAGHELYSLDSPDGRAAATVVVRTAAGRVIARGKSGFA